MRRVRGECLCHGIVVEGLAGTVAQPEPFRRGVGWLGGAPYARCWAVVDDAGGMPHDVPLTWPQSVDRLTDEPTVELDTESHA